MVIPGSLTLYVRAGCHLCEDAQALLHKMNVNVSLVDVDGDPDLVARYGDRVPALVSDGREVVSGIFREPALRKSLGPAR
jgi:glutaredoxin